MSANIKEFLNRVKTVAQDNAKALPDSFVDAMKRTEEVVSAWCDEVKISTPVDMEGGYTVESCNQSFKAGSVDTNIGPEKIVDLCQKAQVAPEHLVAASTLVANVLDRVLGYKAASSFRTYGARVPVQNTVGLETLYPATAIQSMVRTLPLTADAGEESFGINMDRVEPDLRSILTIGLLQFHTNLTPRIVPIKTATQGNVTIVREAMTVFDMSQKVQVPTRLIELYKDPELVSVKAKRIEPLAKNAKNGELVAEGVYAFDKVINLFELALDESRPGYEKYNHTDFVEDGIVLDGLLVKFTKTTTTGEGNEATTTSKEAYVLFKIPFSRGRLTQIRDDLSSFDRRLALDRFPLRVTAATTLSDVLPTGKTNDNSVLAGFTDGKMLALDPHVNAHVDRRVALMNADGFFGDLKVLGAADQAAADALLEGLTAELVGYTMDARYNEDNKRKTSIRAEIVRRSMAYELPTGRNFVIDSAIGQDGVTNAAARLAQLEHIGRDFNNLKIIEEVMKSVHDQNVLANNDKEIRASLAAQYAAGDLVNPTVYVDLLDMSGMYGIRTADASGDVKGYVRAYWNKLTSALLASSFYAQQLADGATVTFRCITSNEIMGNLFMVKHIHSHLETDTKGTGGVEHVVTLDNGVRLELVTTTFDSMKNMIIMIPYLTNSQDSILNFGTDHDQGTLVGAVTIGTDGGASYHRLFSTTRELLIPTNVIGAVVEVTGTSSIAMTDGTGTLTIVQDANA